MKTKKSIAFYVFLAVLFCIVYVLLAARPLTTEYQFVPSWKIDTAVQSPSPLPSGKTALYFRLGQTMGYFTEDGTITSVETFPFKASISDTYYASYTADSSDTPFFRPDGTQAGVIAGSGFPFFDEDRIFVFLPGGSSFARCNPDGTSRWQYGGAVPITAFDSSPAGCTAGFADGTVREFAADGTLVQSFAPGGSDFPVILGAAISSDGMYLATVSGQSRQRFVLARKENQQTKIIFHEYIAGSDPHQRLVQFSRDGKTVWYNFNGGLGIVHAGTMKHTHLRVRGQALSLAEAGNMAFLLTKDGSAYTVYAIEKSDTLCGSFTFTARSAFIRTAGDSLFVGKDTTISRITLEKK